MPRKTYVKQAEFARRIGVQRQYVYKLVQRGVLKKARNGLLDLDACLAAIEKVQDPAYASKIDLEAAKRPRAKAGKKKSAKATRKKAKAKKEAEPPATPATAPIASSTRVPSFADSKAAREFWLSKQAKQTYRRNERELIEAEDVKRDVFRAFRPIRDALLAAPGRMAGVLAPIDDPEELETVLMDLVRDTLEEAAGSIESIFA